MTDQSPTQPQPVAQAAPPAPETGAYPVAAAPVPKRRRARMLAAATAAAVVAGFSGYAVGHVTAEPDTVTPVSNQVEGDGQPPAFPGGQPPSGQMPGGQPPSGQEPGTTDSQGSDTTAS